MSDHGGYVSGHEGCMLHCYRAGSRDAAYKYKNLSDIKFQLKGVLAEVALCSWLLSKHKVKRFLSFATKLLSSHHQPFFVRVSSQSRFLHQRHNKNSEEKKTLRKNSKIVAHWEAPICMCLSEIT